MDNMQKKILELLEEINPYEEVKMETQLVEDGILDSMAIFEFVTLLEDAFDVEIPESAMTKENFATIGTVIALLQSLGRNGVHHDC